MKPLTKGNTYPSKEHGPVTYTGTIVEEDCCIRQFLTSEGKRISKLEEELSDFLGEDNDS